MTNHQDNAQMCILLLACVRHEHPPAWPVAYGSTLPCVPGFVALLLQPPRTQLLLVTGHDRPYFCRPLCTFRIRSAAVAKATHASVRMRIWAPGYDPLPS